MACLLLAGTRAVPKSWDVGGRRWCAFNSWRTPVYRQRLQGIWAPRISDCSVGKPSRVFYAKGVSASGGDFDMVFPATTAALNDCSPIG